MVKVTRRRDVRPGLQSAIAQAKTRIQHEVSKRQQDIEALSADMQKLTTRMMDEDDTEELALEYHRLAKVVKRHKDAIRELEGGALEVEVEVERACSSVSLVMEATEKQVWRERRLLPARQEASRLYLAGGWVRGAGAQSAVYCWTESKQEGGKGWEAVSPMRQARSEHAMSVLGGRLYVMGGRDDEKDYLSSVERYDAEEDRWEYIAAMALPFPTFSLQAVSMLPRH